MPDNRHALLVIGSPKPTGSTSEVLGRSLIDRLAERGWSHELQMARRLYGNPRTRAEFIEAVDRCQLLVLSFPLYVDSLPAPLIRILEEVAQDRADRPPVDNQRMVAIVNCGFPEARHNDVALEICRQFARKSGFSWAGGLSLGGGGAIDGHPLDEAGWLARHIIPSLDAAAEALAAGESIPESAVERMAKPILWSRLYTWFGDRNWRKLAKEHGVADRLDERPFE